MRLALLLCAFLHAAPVTAQVVTGMVRDADRGVVVPGARIFLLHGDVARDSAVSNRAGRFRLTARDTGEHRLFFVMDGWSSYTSSAFALRTDTLRFDFEVPLISTAALAQMSEIMAMEGRLQSALPELCGEPFRPWEAGLLVGVVRDRAGKPVPKARVASPTRSTFANERGVFVLCNVMAGADVAITAEAGNLSGVTPVEIRAGTVSWYDLEIRPRKNEAPRR